MEKGGDLRHVEKSGSESLSIPEIHARQVHANRGGAVNHTELDETPLYGKARKIASYANNQDNGFTASAEEGRIPATYLPRTNHVLTTY